MVETAFRRATTEPNDPRRPPLRRLDLREDAVLERCAAELGCAGCAWRAHAHPRWPCRLSPSPGAAAVTQAESAARTLQSVTQEQQTAQ